MAPSCIYLIAFIPGPADLQLFLLHSSTRRTSACVRARAAAVVHLPPRALLWCYSFIVIRFLFGCFSFIAMRFSVENKCSLPRTIIIFLLPIIKTYLI